MLSYHYLSSKEDFECIALAHIGPKAPLPRVPSDHDHDPNLDFDSFMYQSTCSSLVPSIATLLKKPLYVYKSTMTTAQTNLQYLPDGDNDEVEDLLHLLSAVKSKHPEANAVAVGAIFSNYQRTRVESVCSRLNLKVYAPLWRRPQKEVLDMLDDANIVARIVKVCSAGLDEKHILKSTREMRQVFDNLNDRFGFHVAGEGGEYETICFEHPDYDGKVSPAAEERSKLCTGFRIAR